MDELGCPEEQETGRWVSRVSSSHLPCRPRERAILRFGQMTTLQTFASVQPNVHNRVGLTAATGHPAPRPIVVPGRPPPAGQSPGSSVGAAKGSGPAVRPNSMARVTPR